MSIKITYFVHGTTTDNENGISTGWNGGELSKLGIQRSVELKNLIKDRKFDVVFCSDLKRAVDSATLAFEGKAPIIRDQRLRECNYGDLNGARTNLVDPLQKKVNERFPDGESYEDVKVRIADFLNFLKQNYDGKSVAIISHKAPHLVLDVLIKNKTWDQAFEEYWGNTKAWRPGWEYIL